jgi:hypothetical protein
VISDLEAQATEKRTPLVPAKAETEYNVPAATKVAYLSVYFLLNVSLTIYNKAVLGKVGRQSNLILSSQEQAADLETVYVSMAAHSPPYRVGVDRMLPPHVAGVIHSDQALTPR